VGSNLETNPERCTIWSSVPYRIGEQKRPNTDYVSTMFKLLNYCTTGIQLLKTNSNYQ